MTLISWLSFFFLCVWFVHLIDDRISIYIDWMKHIFHYSILKEYLMSPFLWIIWLRIMTNESVWINFGKLSSITWKIVFQKHRIIYNSGDKMNFKSPNFQFLSYFLKYSMKKNKSNIFNLIVWVLKFLI